MTQVPTTSTAGRATTAAPDTVRLDQVVIRFAGESGDGMQLTGDRFTTEAALLGNDLSTLPNFPAEIRAPRAPCPACPASSCASPTTTCSPPATSPTSSWR